MTYNIYKILHLNKNVIHLIECVSFAKIKKTPVYYNPTLINVQSNSHKNPSYNSNFTFDNFTFFSEFDIQIFKNYNCMFLSQFIIF